MLAKISLLDVLRLITHLCMTMSWTISTAAARGDVPCFSLRLSQKGYSVRNFKAPITLKESWLLANYSDICKIQSRLPFDIDRLETGEVCVRVSELTIPIQSPDELTILRDILLNGEYGFKGFDQAVVIDIGANVGIASIFFATRDAHMVYAYELLPEASNIAKKTLGLNSTIAQKIKWNEFGLSNTDGEIDIPFDPEHLWSTTVSSNAPLGATPTCISKGKLSRASTEIKTICERHSGKPIVLKVDCEGSEYAIFEDLISSGILSSIAIIFLEWHRLDGKDNPDKLRSDLLSNGFIVLGKSDCPGKAGLLTFVSAEPR
jgi:FkbM family methyltransferase